MDRERQSIDFEIIWKYLNGVSTEEENRKLEWWLREEGRNRSYFENARNYFLSDPQAVPPLDVESALARMKQRRKAMHIRVLLQRLTIPAAAVVLVAVLLARFLFAPEGNSEKTDFVSLHQASSIIGPGKNKAVLTIDNGDSFELSGEENLSLDLEGVQITGKGETIEYTTTENKSDNIVKYNTLTIPRGGEFFLILSDGTKVWLNSETTLRYPVSFTANERRVELQGEALFEVASDAAKPFRVESGGQMVEALGTGFNVTAYPSEAILTTLVEGKVRVSLLDSPEKYQILLPGAQSRFQPGTKSLRQYEVNIEDVISWRSGWFAFRNTTLDTMMKTLSRWYNVEIEFKNDLAAGIKFTGNIKRYDDLNKLLSVIEKTNEVKIKIEDNRVIIE